MATLILYSTKHGAAKEFAFIIAEALEGSEVRDVRNPGDIDWERYDTVIVGSSVYAGKMNKRFLHFLKEHQDLLLSRRVHLFVVGGLKDKYLDEARDNFPQPLFEHALSIEYGGYIYDLDKMNLFERVIMRLVAKVKKSERKLNREAALRLARFVEADGDK